MQQNADIGRFTEPSLSNALLLKAPSPVKHRFAPENVTTTSLEAGARDD